MISERVAAITIGAIMLLSMGGFALSGIGRIATTGNTAIDVPVIVNEYMAGDKVASILRTGRVLIRDVYTKQCTDCMSNDFELEQFVKTMGGYVILERASVEPDNKTDVDQGGYVKYEMLSPTGDIKSLHEINITQEGLLEAYCAVSPVQPKECLMLEVSRPGETNGSGNENATGQTYSEPGDAAKYRQVMAGNIDTGNTTSVNVSDEGASSGSAANQTATGGENGTNGG